MPIIRSSRVLYRWSLHVVFGASVFKLSVWCGAEGYVFGLQAAALANHQSTKYHMQRPSVYYSRTPDDGHNGARNMLSKQKICDKYHLLHLVGILFQHIN